MLLLIREENHMSYSGKGDRPRPIPNPEQFKSNWDLIFNKNKPTNKEKNDDSKELQHASTQGS